MQYVIYVCVDGETLESFYVPRVGVMLQQSRVFSTPEYDHNRHAQHEY